MHSNETTVLGGLRELIEDRRKQAGRVGEATLVGLIGRGIQASRTPAMHELEAARQGSACTYVLIDFDRLGLDNDALGAVLQGARECGFAGVNVTHPFKQAIIPYLDGLSTESAAIGAVNTVVLGDGKAVGHNTDCWGFTEAFRTGMQGVSLERVIQFGAGGAGAAVAYALLQMGVRALSIVDTDAERATALAEHMRKVSRADVTATADIAAAISQASGIVNTTPVGMKKYPGMPFDRARLTPDHWVAEIIYFPTETELLRNARGLGCKVLPGIGMAIGQAVRAFELFTGRATDMTSMANHFEAAA
ncbi:shikimate dehydrogenase [Mesorhizobium sp. CAU 1732]|uniref:shikimate dehydrogenase n=1 Tax=Mesorhizobium sp. CAU 1732 TaxID=3140358 RepID=UPI003261279D